MCTRRPRDRFGGFLSPELPVIRWGREDALRGGWLPTVSDSQQAEAKLIRAPRGRREGLGPRLEPAGRRPGEAQDKDQPAEAAPPRPGAPPRSRPFPGCAPARPARGRKRERGWTPDVKATPPNLAQSQAWKAAWAAEAAAGGGGGRDRRGAGSSEPKGTRSDSDGGDPVTAREVSGARAWRRGWRGPAGGAEVGRRGPGGAAGVGGSSHGGDGGPGARQVAAGSPPPPREPLASAGEPPRSGRGGTSAAAGSSALCGRGQMSEIWRRKWAPEEPPAAARGTAAFPAAPRSPIPAAGWVEVRAETRKLSFADTRGFSQLRPGRSSVDGGGGTTPRRPAGSSLTGKKFARIGAGLLHLLREVAEGRQGSEPHLVWQPPRCRDREKNVKGAFPFVSKRKSLFSLAERKSRKSVLFSFFRHLAMSDSETDLSAPWIFFETTPRELGPPDFPWGGGRKIPSEFERMGLLSFRLPPPTLPYFRKTFWPRDSWLVSIQALLYYRSGKSHFYWVENWHYGEGWTFNILN